MVNLDTLYTFLGSAYHAENAIHSRCEYIAPQTRAQPFIAWCSGLAQPPLDEIIEVVLVYLAAQKHQPPAGESIEVSVGRSPPHVGNAIFRRLVQINVTLAAVSLCLVDLAL